MSTAREAVSSCTVCSCMARASAGPSPKAHGLVGASSAGQTDSSASTAAPALGAGASLNGSQAPTPASPNTAKNSAPFSPSAAPDASPRAPRASHRSSQKKYVAEQLSNSDVLCTLDAAGCLLVDLGRLADVPHTVVSLLALVQAYEVPLQVGSQWRPTEHPPPKRRSSRRATAHHVAMGSVLMNEQTTHLAGGSNAATAVISGRNHHAANAVVSRTSAGQVCGCSQIATTTVVEATRRSTIPIGLG